MNNKEYQREYYLKVIKPNRPSHTTPCPDCKGRKMRVGHKTGHTLAPNERAEILKARNLERVKARHITPKGKDYAKAYYRQITPEQKAKKIAQVSAYRKRPEIRAKINAYNLERYHRMKAAFDLVKNQAQED